MEHMQLLLVHIKKGVRIMCYTGEMTTLFGEEHYFFTEQYFLLWVDTKKYCILVLCLTFCGNRQLGRNVYNSRL